MINEIVISILSGMFGAGLASGFSIYIWKLDKKKENDRNRIIALSQINKTIGQLISKFDYQDQIEYHAIFENIESIEYFHKTLINFRLYYFYISIDLIDELEKFENRISQYVDFIAHNSTNENFRIDKYGSDNWSEVNEFKVKIYSLIKIKIKENNVA